MERTLTLAVASIFSFLLCMAPAFADQADDDSDVQTQSESEDDSDDESGETGSAGENPQIGIDETDVDDVADGWSVKRGLIGKSVYNDRGDKIGKVEDIVITPDNSLSFVILNTAGYV